MDNADITKRISEIKREIDLLFEKDKSLRAEGNDQAEIFDAAIQDSHKNINKFNDFLASYRESFKTRVSLLKNNMKVRSALYMEIIELEKQANLVDQ